MPRSSLFGSLVILVAGGIAVLAAAAHSASAAEDVKWEHRPYPGVNRGINGILVTGNHVQLGMIGEAARSLDGGETWQLSVLDTPTIVNGFCWARNRMYASSDFRAGILYSDDSGLTWKRYSQEGLTTTSFEKVFADDTYLFAKSWEGLFRVPLGGSVWTRLDSGKNGVAGFWDFAVLGRIIMGTKEKQIHLSYDHGDSWVRPPPGILDSLPIKAGPIRNGSWVYAADSSSVLVSKDSGITWTRSFTGIPFGVRIRDIAAHGDQVFVTTNDYSPQVYRSTDQGRTWNPFASGLPPGMVLYGIAANDAFLYTYSTLPGYWRIPITAPTSLVPRAPAQRRATRTWKSGIASGYSLLGRWVRPVQD